MNSEQNLQKRISRIKGQVEGIERMVSEKRDCLDVIQQIAAVRSALAKVGIELLKTETVSCVRDSEQFEKLLNSLFRLS